MPYDDFGSQWDRSAPDFLETGEDVLARAPRVPRDRPDRPSGGGANAPYLSGDPAIPDMSEYNIQITFQGTWTTDLRQAFISAAEAISDFILGDIPAAGTRRSPIDDLVISASLVSIDGAGGILGQAGPDAVRPGSFLPSKSSMFLPSKSSMEFDIADANYYQSLGLFDDIVLHEMLHAVGFCT